MLFTIRPLLIILFLSTLFISCNGGEMPEKTIFKSIQDVPVSAWEELSKKKIFLIDLIQAIEKIYWKKEKLYIQKCSSFIFTVWE